jgi:plasmid stability protein
MEVRVANLTLRGCDEELTRALKEASARRGLSVNRFVLETLRESLLGRGKKPRRYDDLKALVGTWSVAEAEAFDMVTEDFERIDPELWPS